MRFPHIMRPPVALAPHHRYRAENQQLRQQPRTELGASCMAQSDSEPCTQRQLAASDLQQPAPAACVTALEERAPAAGPSDSDQQAPPAETRPEPAEAVKKKAAEGSSVVCCGGEPSTRRPPAAADQESARERLKRHRTEMAGRVRIPDMWGQERLLKDWVDCAVFDRPLAATAGLLNARDALVAECAAARRAAAGHASTGRPLRVQNGCS